MSDIRLTNRAAKDIKRLSKKAKKQIAEAIEELAAQPSLGYPLKGEWKGFYKIRTGDYRIIYQIAQEDVIEIMYVRHRREAYRSKE